MASTGVIGTPVLATGGPERNIFSCLKYVASGPSSKDNIRPGGPERTDYVSGPERTTSGPVVLRGPSVLVVLRGQHHYNTLAYVNTNVR